MAGCQQVGLGEQHRCSRIFEHEGETFGGIGRVKRQVGAAGLEDAEDADDHLQRALDTDADQDIRSHAKRVEVVRQLVGAGVELGIGQLLILEDNRYGVGRARYLFLEEFVNAFVLRIIGSRVVPLDEQLVTLGFGEQRQLGDGLRRVVHNRLQQGLEMARHALDGRFVEEIGAEDPGALQLVADLPKVCFEVEACGVHASGALGHAQSSQFQFAHRGVLQGKHDLHQRVVVEVAWRLQFLDQALEGQVLMVVG